MEEDIFVAASTISYGAKFISKLILSIDCKILIYPLPIQSFLHGIRGSKLER